LIYVRRDLHVIPMRVLKVAERMREKLAALPVEQRRAFIKKKSHVWRAFGRYLAKMSHGKCWYSESPDPHSFFDVDHFRPKAEAQRKDGEVDEGYPWLAFTWENFRYAAGRANRYSKHEESEEILGKGSWFPLFEGSPIASWENRCEEHEQPILLDPTVIYDVHLLEVKADGRIGPSQYCHGSDLTRVENSVKLYGLNVPRLKAARLRAMREIAHQAEVLGHELERCRITPTHAFMNQIKAMLLNLAGRSEPLEPYAAAVRSQLILSGFGDLCRKAEERGDAPLYAELAER
jgi:hypothetical protein